MSRIGLMLDIETLGIASDAVVIEIAMVPFDLYDEDRFADHVGEFREYLPVDPQIAAGSTVSASTLAWWMGSDQVSDRARIRMSKRLEGDTPMLAKVLERAAFNMRSWRKAANGDGFELWAKGPQFDVVILERLLNTAGIHIPYKYNEVRDLRTLIKEADLDLELVTKPKDFIAHSALSDCRFQIASYYAARTKLGTHGGVQNLPL